MNKKIIATIFLMASAQTFGMGIFTRRLAAPFVGGRIAHHFNPQLAAYTPAHIRTIAHTTQVSPESMKRILQVIGTTGLVTYYLTDKNSLKKAKVDAQLNRISTKQQKLIDKQREQNEEKKAQQLAERSTLLSKQAQKLTSKGLVTIHKKPVAGGYGIHDVDGIVRYLKSKQFPILQTGKKMATEFSNWLKATVGNSSFIQNRKNNLLALTTCTRNFLGEKWKTWEQSRQTKKQIQHLERERELLEAQKKLQEAQKKD